MLVMLLADGLISQMTLFVERLLLRWIEGPVFFRFCCLRPPFRWAEISA